MAFGSYPLTVQTRRPSPTTIQYTVSTAPPCTTRISRVLFNLANALRIYIFALSLLTLYAKARLIAAPAEASCQAIPRGLDKRIAEWTPAFVLATAAQGWVVVGLAVGLAWACSRRDHVEESLLLIRGLGVQTSTSSLYFCLKPMTRFIPTPQIQDILIHEAFKGFEVKFYLAIVVEGEEEVVVVFPKLLPKREILEEAWRGAKACLYEPAKANQ